MNITNIRNRKHTRWLVLPLSVLCMSWSASSFSESNWAVEEVLLQLQELKREINALKNRAALLESENREIKSKLSGKVKRINSVSLNGSVTIGNPKAKIAIIEFSDFQCPYCKRHHKTTYGQLKRNYIDTDKVQYVINDFPLSFHTQAVSASIAASCAGLQGKYMDMHAKLFAAQSQLGQVLYEKSAMSIGLDMFKFKECSADSGQKDKVEKHMQYGSSLGVTGTPAFFIGKVVGNEIKDVKVVKGAQSFTRFSTILESMLKKQG